MSRGRPAQVGAMETDQRCSGLAAVALLTVPSPTWSVTSVMYLVVAVCEVNIKWCDCSAPSVGW